METGRTAEDAFLRVPHSLGEHEAWLSLLAKVMVAVLPAALSTHTILDRAVLSS